MSSFICATLVVSWPMNRIPARLPFPVTNSSRCVGAAIDSASVASRKWFELDSCGRGKCTSQQGAMRDEDIDRTDQVQRDAYWEVVPDVLVEQITLVPVVLDLKLCTPRHLLPTPEVLLRTHRSALDPLHAILSLVRLEDCLVGDVACAWDLKVVQCGSDREEEGVGQIAGSGREDQRVDRVVEREGGCDGKDGEEGRERVLEDGRQVCKGTKDGGG